MIPRFDADDAFADAFGMGYSKYSTELKVECVRRYFSPPRISVRLLALEKGIPFETVSEWIKKAKRAGMLNPGEPIPAMVEVKAALPPAEAREEPAPAQATVTISIGKATVTMPSSLLSQALEALLGQ